MMHVSRVPWHVLDCLNLLAQLAIVCLKGISEGQVAFVLFAD